MIGTETSAPVARPASAGKVTVGVIGNGGHGSWITKLFKVPGSHEMWAVADCFQDVAP
ncbi:MAG: hypothetical protein HZA93_21335 [Verrucomicrobia bacterium]|nr:hypothetical protein [Verrucomicrobiota bacterium]